MTIRMPVITNSHQLIITLLAMVFIIITVNGESTSEIQQSISYVYYNNDNPKGIPFQISSISQGVLLNWRKSALVKIITHGWLGNANLPAVASIKDAYLQMKDVNIITVDWRNSAGNYFYPLQIKRARVVGKVVAQLIDTLIYAELTSSDFLHLIGHSAGAHVMGVASANAETGIVGRITGLDPARLGFQSQGVFNRNILSKNDAHFVDIIHTTLTLGYSRTRGHADFWPNGKPLLQPGCNGLTCSHGRAYDFFADSIIHPHRLRAWQCDSWESFEDGDCVSNPSVFMGDETLSSTRGGYYLTTNEEPPYGKG